AVLHADESGDVQVAGAGGEARERIRVPGCEVSGDTNTAPLRRAAARTTPDEGAVMRTLPVLCLSIACLAACVGSAPQPGSEPVVAVAPSGETEPTRDEANAVALWVDEADPAASLVIGSAGLAGIEVYGLDGARRARVETGGEVASLGILTGFPLGGAAVPLVVALEVPAPRVLLYRLDGASGALAPVALTGMEPSGAYEGLCTYRSVLDGKSYV